MRLAVVFSARPQENDLDVEVRRRLNVACKLLSSGVVNHILCVGGFLGVNPYGVDSLAEAMSTWLVEVKGLSPS